MEEGDVNEEGQEGEEGKAKGRKRRKVKRKKKMGKWRTWRWNWKTNLRHLISSIWPNSLPSPTNTMM